MNGCALSAVLMSAAEWPFMLPSAAAQKNDSHILSGLTMPLPPPTAERTRVQIRSIPLNGYKRVDGRWDIEAHLTDLKDHDYLLATELLMSLPTAALQTLASEVRDNAESEQKPDHLDRCYALDSHSEAVQRYYPRWYRGPKSTA